MTETPRRKACPECDGTDLYATEAGIGPGGGYSPNLLPGLEKLFSRVKLQGVLCADCGYYRQFADDLARQRVRESTKWRRL